MSVVIILKNFQPTPISGISLFTKTLQPRRGDLVVQVTQRKLKAREPEKCGENILAKMQLIMNQSK